MDDLTGPMLEKCCKGAKTTAPSLDQWSTAELQLLPTCVFDLLAIMLNRIELEGSWPSSLCFAKAVFLYKDDPVTAGPLDLRILLILSTVYRRRASTRPQCLEPWIAKWKEEEMFSGVPGMGAEDASYATSVLKEWFAMQGLHFS